MIDVVFLFVGFKIQRFVFHTCLICLFGPCAVCFLEMCLCVRGMRLSAVGFGRFVICFGLFEACAFCFLEMCLCGSCAVGVESERFVLYIIDFVFLFV